MLTTRLSYRAHPAQAFFLFIIAALACAVSVVLTVRFCLDLRGEDGVFAGLIAVGIGLAWEISKYVYAPVGVRFALSGRPSLTAGGIGLCFVCGVLVVGSICASLGYLTELDIRQRDVKLRNSADYRDAQARLAAVDEEIAILTRTASADADHSYRKRALSTLATVRELRVERAEVRASLATMRAPSSDVAKGGVFGGLASLLPVDAGRIRSVAYAIVSTMLELISLVAIVLLGAGRKPQAAAPASGAAAEPPASATGYEVAPAQQVPRHDEAVTAAAEAVPQVSLAPVVMFTSHGRSLKAQAVPSMEDEVERLDDASRYEKAKEMVRGTQVAPTLRALQSALQLGQGSARNFLRLMEEDGIVQRVGRRYVVAEAVT